MAAGAASLSDSSMSSPIVVVLLVVGRGDIDLVELVARRGRQPARRCRPLDVRDEVADDLFGDVQAALELGDGLGRGIEDDDVVRALAVAVRWGRRAGGVPTG